MDIQEIALGELNLHPWELDRYTYKDLVYKIRGHRKVVIEDWERARIVAFYAFIGGGHAKKKLTPEKLFRLAGDKGNTLKDQLEDIKNKQELYEKYKTAKLKKVGKT